MLEMVRCLIVVLFLFIFLTYCFMGDMWTDDEMNLKSQESLYLLSTSHLAATLSCIWTDDVLD